MARRSRYQHWEARATLDRDLEDPLLRKVIELCEYLHLLWYHTHDSRRCTPGFPDLEIVGPGGILHRELKSARGEATPEQLMWLNMINLAGGDAAIWRPADLTSGRISKELQALRHLRDPTRHRPFTSLP